MAKYCFYTMSSSRFFHIEENVALCPFHSAKRSPLYFNFPFLSEFQRRKIIL